MESSPFVLLWWHWCVGGLILMGLEILLPGVFLLWIGLGAVGAGAVTALTGITSWEAQCVVFLPLLFASLYLGRKYIRKAAPQEDDTLNRRTASYVGRKVEVAEAIVNGKGRVRLGDSLWTARGEDCPAGSMVTITGGSGAELSVERVDPAKDNL